MQRDHRSEEGGNTRFSVHEFLIDFLGGLVPGILFTVAAFFAVFLPLHGMFLACCPEQSKSLDAYSLKELVSELLGKSANTPNMIWIAAFVFGLILSYVVGHLFYRRDPKEADKKSFRLISRSRRAREESVESLRRDYACANEVECEFPYAHFDEYLKARDHVHLLRLIPWVKDRTQRSKTYINRLKVRLAYYFPDKCRPIIRNEAHVRLATSTWYVGGALYWLSGAGLALACVAISIVCFRGFCDSGWHAVSWALPILAGPVLVLSAAIYSRHSIEKFIHYQRLREVFYVLELAYTAFRDTPWLLTSPVIDFTKTPPSFYY